jgi:putative transposase
MSAKKHHSSESIIRKLRQAEVYLHEGKSISEVCRSLGISDATYYKWRKEYGGLQVSQTKRLKELEKENNRLKKAVADLTVDKLILQEVVQGK